MSKQRDDTPEQIDPSGDERDTRPASYYYDDSTGYEVYDPEKDDEEEDGDELQSMSDRACADRFF